MSDESNAREEVQLATSYRMEPDELLAIVANGVSAFEPIVGHLAKLCADASREGRLQVEAQLAARLRELAIYFDKLDELRAREVSAREKQYEALVVLLELARRSGDHHLIAEAMKCFQDFVKNSPALTHEFVEAVRAFDHSLK